MLVFQKGGKSKNLMKNPGARPEPITNSTQARIKPGSHWWKVRALTTGANLLPGQRGKEAVIQWV